MPITAADVGRNSFNLFAVDRNGARDTPGGVWVRVRSHDRNHLAGRAQEPLRLRWGLHIDPDTADGVIILGHTIASLRTLRNQFDTQNTAATRANRDTTVEQLATLLRAVNTLEWRLEVDLTTRRDVDNQFDDAFDGGRAAKDAMQWLTDRQVWLTAATNFLPQIDRLRSIFSGQTLDVTGYGLKADTWSVSYSAMDRLIADPSLAIDVEHHVAGLYDQLQAQLTEAGFSLEELSNDRDYSSIRILPVDDSSPSELWFDPNELTFSLVYQGDDVKTLTWKGAEHPWSSVDALLLLTQLTVLPHQRID